MLMMRTSCVVALISHLPPIDVYTGLHLSKKHFSVEHIIPKRLFHERSHANDLINLAPCDRSTNHRRSDYRYGELDADVSNEHDLLLSSRQEVAGFVNRRRRTFYPSTNADKGLISRSIIQLLHKYPYLYANLFDIVDHPNTLSKWSSQHPPSFYEEQRELYLLSPCRGASSTIKQQKKKKPKSKLPLLLDYYFLKNPHHHESIVRHDQDIFHIAHVHRVRWM